MSFYNQIYESAVLPLSDKITHWQISKSLKFLKKSQWWKYNDLRAFQEKRLKIMIHHAYENVPYYKELFASNHINPNDIQRIEDLHQIPLLTKELVTENFNNGKLIAKTFNNKRSLLKQSSGSTGLKTIFYIDKVAYGFNIACNLRGWDWMGYRFGDKILKVSQNKRHSAIKRIQDYVDRTKVFYQSYNEEHIRSFYKTLFSFKPVFLRSYPDPLIFLCSMINKNNLKLPQIKAINTTGNILFPEYRTIIENTFACKIFDSYSCEGGANFFECSTHECYHVSMEYAISEIINSDGIEVGSGEKGLHITTDLWNFATPFIRYNSQDIVEKSMHPCSCGRELPSISRIIGRDNDILITSKGEYIIAQSFTTYFKYLPSVLMFQVYQQKISKIEFRLIVTDEYNQNIENQISNYWKKHFGADAELTFRIIDNIPTLPSGKNRFVIRDKSISLML